MITDEPQSECKTEREAGGEKMVLKKDQIDYFSKRSQKRWSNKRFEGDRKRMQMKKTII